MLIMDILRTNKKKADEYVAAGKYLTKKAESCYKAGDRLSQGADVSVTSPNVCYVTYRGSASQIRRTVDLEAKTCSCTKWQQFKLPCHHAIGAARATGRLSNMKAWYDHAFGSFYLAANYAAAYANVAVFLPQMETVEGDGVTLPAERVTQAGRPQNKRIRSRGGAMGDGVSSKRVRYSCGTCGSKKHNRARCDGSGPGL
jgi:hypothetical protein